MPDYGYLHLGRVISQDPISGGYLLESVKLAANKRWGPVPSCVPGLTRGDRVILGAKGTSRDDLVILGRVNAAFPNVGDIDGLLEALATKALAVDLDQTNNAVLELSGDLGDLDDRMDEVEADNLTQDGLIAAQAATIAAQGLAIAALQAATTPSFGVDYHVNSDLISNCQRAMVTSFIAIPNGEAHYIRLFTRRAINVNTIKLAFNATGQPAGGSTAIAMYAGTNLAALPQVYSGTDGVGPNRIDVFPSPAVAVPANRHIVVGILPLGMGGAESIKLAATPVNASLSMLTQGGNQIQHVGLSGQSALATTLKIDNISDWNVLQGQLPWLALGGNFP